MAQVKESQVIEILKQCFDPELPIDLWNLGLIYNIDTQESYDELHSDVNIVMSLTTPGCTMGQQMSLDIKNKLEGDAIFGMSIALFGKISTKNGAVEQNNFFDYQMTRMKDTPKIHIDII